MNIDNALQPRNPVQDSGGSDGASGFFERVPGYTIFIGGVFTAGVAGVAGAKYLMGKISNSSVQDASQTLGEWA